MTDRLLHLANAPWTAPILRALGLPQPRPLPRRSAPYAAPEFAARDVLVLAAAGGFAHEACRRSLAAQGANLSPAGDLHAVVVDATGCAAAPALDFLHDQVRCALGRLLPGGRVLLIAHAAAAGPEAQACARAVEGFTRSLARELGRRAATANCLCVAPDALGELAAPLAFFCTDRSAYVSGQALRWRDAAAVDADPGADRGGAWRTRRRHAAASTCWCTTPASPGTGPSRACRGRSGTACWP